MTAAWCNEILKASPLGSIVSYNEHDQDLRKLHYLQYRYLRKAIQHHWRLGNYDPELQLLPKPSENLANWDSNKIYNANESMFLNEESDDDIDLEAEEFSD